MNLNNSVLNYSYSHLSVRDARERQENEEVEEEVEKWPPWLSNS